MALAVKNICGRSLSVCAAFGKGARSRLLSTSVRSLATHENTAADTNLTQVTENKGIRIITLDNEHKRNALSLSMLDSIKKNLETVTDDLRVVILRAKGPVFSAGHNLKELTTEDGTEYHRKVFDKCTEVMTLVQDMPVPVVAEVRGLATAAGCQLVASCDVAIASDQSRFATPGVSVGLFCSTPAVAVGRSVPRKIAMKMLLTGHPISAQEAYAHGLVSQIVPEEKLEEETMNLAHRICETSRSVTALGKACFYRQMALSRDDAYRVAADTMVENLQLVDGQEGIRAFSDKNSPTWTHGFSKVKQ